MARSCVVDKNFLQNPLLEEFLVRDPGNRAVLTDFLAIECFAGTSLRNLSRSLVTLAKFPSQVLVLRSSRDLARLGPIDPNLRFEMVDWRQTRSFAKFCEQVASVEKASESLRRRLEQQAADAQRHLDQILEFAPQLVGIIEAFHDDTGDELLKARRVEKAMPGKEGVRLLKSIIYLAERCSRFDDQLPTLPDDPAIASRCYPFRLAICLRILSLWWAEHGGGVADANHAKLRNDVVDLGYAIAATYWDGFLTLDSKAREIYGETDFLANEFFPGPKRPGARIDLGTVPGG